MKKRILGLLLAFVMVLSLLPSTALAENTDKAAASQPVTAALSMSFDDHFLSDSKGNPIAPLQSLTVPYFDLGLYGLQDLYFRSENYTPGKLPPADPAVYEGKVTVLHMVIYATEVLYCGVPADEAGQGYLKDQNLLGTNVLAFGSTTPGSLFFSNIWGMDGNLNYYINHTYPQASGQFGSTADQILLHNGDVITFGGFSSMSFFMDPRAPFNHICVNNIADAHTVDAADTLTINVSHSGGNSVSQGTETIVSKIDYPVDVYATDASKPVDGDVTTWTHIGTTDSTGTLTLTAQEVADAAQSGNVILGVPGQKGADYPDEFVCTPAAFRLTINSNADVGPSGDITGDGQLNADDLQAATSLFNAGIALNEAQMAAADMNADGEFDFSDIILMYALVNGQ